MKYFIFSDIHGEYDKLMKSLDAAGFDLTNPNHTLVTLLTAANNLSKCLSLL